MAGKLNKHRLSQLVISQRELRKLGAVQRSFAISHSIWCKVVEDALGQVKVSGKLTPELREALAAFSTQLITIEALRTEMQEVLRSRLKETKSKVEAGALSLRLIPSKSPSCPPVLTVDDQDPPLPMMEGRIPSDLVMAIKGNDGTFKWANASFSAVLGQPLSSLLGKSAKDIWPGDYGQRVFENDLAVVKSGVPTLFAEELQTEGGVKNRLAIRFPLAIGNEPAKGIGVVDFDSIPNLNPKSAA